MPSLCLLIGYGDAQAGQELVERGPLGDRPLRLLEAAQKEVSFRYGIYEQLARLAVPGAPEPAAEPKPGQQAKPAAAGK